MLTLTLCTTGLASAAVQERPLPRTVAVPNGGLSSSPGPLKAFWFTAQSTAAAPPAVIMLHGCGGAYERSGALNGRHRMWGETFAAMGFHALMLDSFTSRGINELCTQKFRDRTLKEADRVGDAYAALDWLRSQPGVDPHRIAVMGWSHGGGVTLDVVTRPPVGAPRFAAAVSFYPGCTARAARSDTFTPYAPLLLIMGDADDWTPAAPCKALAAAVAARGAPMQIHTYPDTYHDFDSPSLKEKRVRKEVPNGVNPGEGVTVAPNPEAREDAKLRVKAFLEQTFQSPCIKEPLCNTVP